MKSMIRVCFSSLAVAALFSGQADCAESGDGRIALVIGNSAYSKGQPEISGKRDAEAMDRLLTDLGFKVDLVVDADKSAMEAAQLRFQQAIVNASAVVFFFSGHGFQSKDRANYLMPTDGSIDPGSSISLESFVKKLVKAPAESPKFVFLDACRTATNIPEGEPKGLAEVKNAPFNVLHAFAARPGGTAPSGEKDQLSPYTAVLLQQMRVPGIPLQELFQNVHSALVVQPNYLTEPTETDLSQIPADFYFRPPVHVTAIEETAKADERNDHLIVLLNGEIAMDRSSAAESRKRLRLRAGLNHLSLLMADQKTSRNHQTWQVTEGWSYALRLFGPGGLELRDADCRAREKSATTGAGPACFADGEDAPFRNGPRHGRVFTVARMDLYVDPTTADVEVRGLEKEVWKSSPPLYAQNQACLYSSSLGDLGLEKGPADLQRYRKLFEVARKLVDLLHLSGSVRLPELAKVYVQVRGNGEFRREANICMSDPLEREERLIEAAEGLKAALAGSVTRPFDPFEAELSRCVFERLSQAGAKVSRDEVHVWTNLAEVKDGESDADCRPTEGGSK